MPDGDDRRQELVVSDAQLAAEPFPVENTADPAGFESEIRGLEDRRFHDESKILPAPFLALRYDPGHEIPCSLDHPVRAAGKKIFGFDLFLVQDVQADMPGKGRGEERKKIADLPPHFRFDPPDGERPAGMTLSNQFRNRFVKKRLFLHWVIIPQEIRVEERTETGYNGITDAPVAQRTERQTSNLRVGSSSLSGRIGPND